LLTSYFGRPLISEKKIRPDILYLASQDIRHPALRLAGYPAKSVSFASLLGMKIEVPVIFVGRLYNFSVQYTRTGKFL
jgi:hypothetical protein